MEDKRKSKKKRGNGGFAMLEVMLLSLVFLVMAAAALSASAAIGRRAVRQIERSEAYYAAVTAARMMEAELLSGEEGEISETAYVLRQGMPETEGTIQICTAGEIVQVPVSVSTEKMEDGCLMIKAEAMVGKQRGEAAVMVPETSSGERNDVEPADGKTEAAGKEENGK